MQMDEVTVVLVGLLSVTVGILVGLVSRKERPFVQMSPPIIQMPPGENPTTNLMPVLANDCIIVAIPRPPGTRTVTKGDGNIAETISRWRQTGCTTTLVFDTPVTITILRQYEEGDDGEEAEDEILVEVTKGKNADEETIYA